MEQRLYTFWMKESTPVYDYLDDCNKFFIDLENINCKVDDEDQALNFLCSLSHIFQSFVGIVLYGSRRNNNFVNDVKDALNSKELEE